MHDPQNEKDCRSCGEPTTGGRFCEVCDGDDGDASYDYQKENPDE